jgi:hypothetical protein
VAQGAAPPTSDLVVFAQRSDAAVDIDAWSAHAERFFATRIGLADVSHRDPLSPPPMTDSVRIVVAPPSGAPGIRRASARPRSAEDLALAEAADARRGGTGLARLARRCGMVWVVAREPAESSSGRLTADSSGRLTADPLALRLAVVLSSVLLGPVLDVAAGSLFGAATGRGMLDSILK